MTTDEILNNMDDLNPEQLFDYISKGLITLEELKATGNLDATKRANIQKLQTAHDKQDDNDWEHFRYGNEESIRNYIAQYGINGRHTTEAKMEIERMNLQRQKEQGLRADYIQKINSNGLTPDMIQEYLAKGIINESDLRNECQIPDEIIEKIKTYRPLKDIDLGETPSNIPDGFTEVYFWGIPDSGKTCALSTILNTAYKKGYMQTGEGPGLRYLHSLKNLFKTDDGIGYLLEGTVDKTQYLPFALTKQSEQYPRSVSLIELSGEVFKCFKKMNLGEALGALEDTFKTLKGYLNGNNRKIHFFFIDYESTSIKQDSYTQSDYLSEASKYFTKENIFKKNTDAIYVVITKSDLIEGYESDEELLIENINKYIDDNFLSFDIYLNRLCKSESINGGEYGIIPFSIGDVYCKRICKINRKPAEIIINQLFMRIAPQKKSILDVLNK